MIEVGFKFGLGLLLAYLVITSPLWLLVLLCGGGDASPQPKPAEDHKEVCRPNDETLMEELKGIWPSLKWALPVPLLIMLIGIYGALVH